jgi:hypothetical protein
MDKEKLEWMPVTARVIGITVLISQDGDAPDSVDQGIFSTWEDALRFIAETYGFETDVFVAEILTEISEQVGMSAKRVWGQWFKKEPRKLISWMRFNNLIRVLWIE